MNIAREPLGPEAVDLLLSAELDGDLDAAARDLGLSTAEARAGLDAAAGVDGRRLALTRARDLLAVAPAFEAGDADRLVAAALAGDALAAARDRHIRRDRRATQWRILVATGSVAAAVALVVGIASMQGHSSNSKSARAIAPTTKHAAAKPSVAAGRGASSATPDFGDVTNPAALDPQARALLHSVDAADSSRTFTTQTNAAKSAAQPTALSTQQRASGPEAGAADNVNGPSFDAAGPPDCRSAIRARYAIKAQPAVEGTGTVSGRAVRILIFGGTKAPVAYIVSAADCALVRKQPLG